MSADGASVETRTARRAPAILIVDDEPDLREVLALSLERLGFDVAAVESLAEARARLATQEYALCLTDMRLPDGLGLELVREVAGSDGPPIAVITAFGSAENAVAALKAGAFDYLTKPVDPAELRRLVQSAVRAAAPASGPREGGSEPTGGAARLIGASPAIVALRSMVARVARSMAPVLIQGESGSGKEVVARALHEASQRASQPFVPVNCGAIPEALMEAEFFGYRKGAFTGADRDRIGFFQAAAGGTLFLDEIADLPLLMQVKLLRVIQERRVRPLGSAREEAVDVRIVSATHQDLARAVAGGRFRQDLFYRLNVIELRVPSLRERPEDIPVLAAAILARLAARAGQRDVVLLDAAALGVLARHDFPGNVRELENILERAVALAEGDVLTAADLRIDLADAASAVPPAGEAESGSGAAIEALPRVAVADGVPADLQAFLDEVERDAIRAALGKTGNVRTAAAPLLGLTFRQLRYRMQRLGLK